MGNGDDDASFSPTSVNAFLTGSNGCIVAAPTPSPPPNPPTNNNELTSGVAVTGLSGASGSTVYYTMTMPANAQSVTCSISGGSGDADLFTKWDSPIVLGGPNVNTVCCIL